MLPAFYSSRILSHRWRRSKNGSLWVRGGIEMEADDGLSTKLNRRTLCRCGRSSNKPYYDGIHKEVGFEAD